MGMDELILTMSDEDLATLKAKYSDNPSVTTLINGILEGRVKQAEQVKAKVDFERGITKLFAKLPHPEDVHNVFVRWGEVEVEDTTAEAEEVQVEGGEPEMRYPTHTEYQWIVQVNKVTKVTSGSTEAKSSKRAITIYKRNGLVLENKGNFGSASKACEALGLAIGGDSAMRVLARDGFITEPYEGTDYS